MVKDKKNNWLKHDYYAWVLVDDSFFNNQINIDKVIYDGHGYCILSGNIRVDVYSPAEPQSDIYKKEREAWNYVDMPFVDEIKNNLAILVSKFGCDHDYSNYKTAISYVAKNHGVDIHFEEAIRYARNKGGFCDCEILLNL